MPNSLALSLCVYLDIVDEEFSRRAQAGRESDIVNSECRSTGDRDVLNTHGQTHGRIGEADRLPIYRSGTICDGRREFT